MRRLMIIGLTMCLACAWGRPALAAPEIGQPAPELKGELLDGTAYDLAGLKGQVVIVDFWASWCVPCREEMPVLDAYYQTHKGQGLAVLAISVDRNRARDEAVKQMQAYHFPAGMWGDVTENGFGWPGAIPVSYIIDKKGIIRARLIPDPDPVTAAGLEAAIDPLLKSVN